MKNTLSPLAFATALIMAGAIAPQSFAAEQATVDHSAHAAHAKPSTPSAIFSQQMMDMHANMAAFEKASNQEEAFILGMIPHHQTAIEMAKVLKEQSKDATMLKLADDIIKAQNQEIAVMQKMLAEVKVDGAINVTTDGLAEAKAAYTAINNKMHEAKAADDNANVDVAFIVAMVPHHQGAIDMAKVYLKYGKHPELTKMCNDIINAQSSEIELMNSKL